MCSFMLIPKHYLNPSPPNLPIPWCLCWFYTFPYHSIPSLVGCILLATILVDYSHIIHTSFMFQLFQEQRSKVSFNPVEITNLLYGNSDDFYRRFHEIVAKIDFTYDPNIFNLSRVDQMKLSIKYLPKINPIIDINDILTVGASNIMSQFELPGSLHVNMFVPCIKILGSEPQGERLLEKCRNFEIIGCYAQTELGHGSDVQNLETTATLDLETDEFVINSPSISAAKYWPGDLGSFANYALVFAKMIIKDVNHGVQSFLVQIRDENGKPLPGVDVGDLGPKFGFHTKDNGFLMMKNLRTHRKNMLRRYAKVEKDGSFTLRGNQKISYATMMLIRKLISMLTPKIYGTGLVIAGRYSMIRKQFRDDQKQEITLMDYQLQQNKILSCLADYYAISAGGSKVSKMADINFINVSEKDDESLMKETHNCLCLTKAFNSEISNRDLEICRLACGGHGFSQYSGLPHLCQSYSANVTYEGENTVMYLQLARYLMKSYKYTITKKKDLDTSVAYFNNMADLLGQKSTITDLKALTIAEVKQLLAQSVYYYVSAVGEKMMDEGNQKDIWNYKAGVRLHQAARAHATYWTYESFVEIVDEAIDPKIKDVLGKVCLLFGVNMLFENMEALVEGGVLAPQQVTLLRNKKEELLKQLRPSFTGLLEAVGMPEKSLKSDMISGDVYKKLFERAKQNPINHEMSPAVDIVKKGLTNCRPKL